MPPYGSGPKPRHAETASERRAVLGSVTTAPLGHLGWPWPRASASFLVLLAIGCSDDPATSNEPEPGAGGSPTTGGAGNGGGTRTGGAGGTGGTSPKPHKPRLPPPQPNSPEIEVWYGTEQTIGGVDEPAPQRWVNVLGRVHESTASAATYSLNGAPEVPFPMGPTTTRLLGSGDFNLELDRADLALLPDVNTVDIWVERGSGDPLFHRVVLAVHPPAFPPPHRLTDFRTLQDVSEVNRLGAIVDGAWHLTEDGLRTSELGYDRLIALGSQTWTGNYEAFAEFTVHSMRNWGAVGVAVGWQGHEGDQDPREDWPLQALGWVRRAVPQTELQIMAFWGGVLARQDFDLDFETPYLLRLRTQRTGSGSWAFLNVWPKGEAEPESWLLTSQTPDHDGSVLLVTHHADVTWAEVRVTPLE